jgi:hypothetical protein
MSWGQNIQNKGDRGATHDPATFGFNLSTLFKCTRLGVVDRQIIFGCKSLMRKANWRSFWAWGLDMRILPIFCKRIFGHGREEAAKAKADPLRG